tara:strand:- start:838 stop:1005 length:168 start_codon:yes stop_codon:yes gene_type:complete
MLPVGCCFTLRQPTRFIDPDDGDSFGRHEVVRVATDGLPPPDVPTDGVGAAVTRR